MDTPQLYTYQQRAGIPTDRGIYAFYLDLAYLVRSLKKPGATPQKLNSLLDRFVAAHTASNPSDSEFNVFGRTKTFTAVYTIQASHMIRRGPVPSGLTPAQLLQLAAVLDKCALLAAPIYIGIAEKQSLASRYGQHLAKYNKIKNQGTVIKGTGRNAFDRRGSFAANLVRRGLQFSHVLFACIPLTVQELDHVRLVEKLFHAAANPALSESH